MGKKLSVSGIAIAASLVIGLTTTTPAYSAPVDDSEVVVETTGQLLVVADGGWDFTVEAHEEADIDEHTSEVLAVSIVTAGGQVVEVEGEFAHDVASGDTFVGSLAVPEEIADALDLADGETLDASSAEGTEVMELAEEESIPLEVRSASVGDMPVANAFTASPHYFDVAVVDPSNGGFDGSGLVDMVADSEVDSYVLATGNYWRTETNNAIQSFTKPLATQRYSSTLSCASSNSTALWQEAATKFGRTLQSYYDGSTQRHLLVILPNECAFGSNIGAGIGSVGSIHAGGVVIASDDGDTALPVIAHEVGHNLGLGHSGLVYCNAFGISDGPGCTTYEYDDWYSVMGYAFQGYPALPALPAPMRAFMQSYPAGALTTVPAAGFGPPVATTVTLQAASAASGVRGIKLTDPRTGNTFYVELRSGTGTDSGALYRQGFSGCLDAGNTQCWTTGTGVRILSGASSNSALDSFVHTVATDPSDPGFAYSALYPGEKFASRSGGATVTVNSLSPAPPSTYTPGFAFTSANITITLNKGPEVVRYAGVDRFGTSALIASKFPSADVAYVALGYNYPDALSAAPAAAVQNGPLLLTAPDALPEAIAAELRRLKPERIVVVGSAASISAKVFTQLEGLYAGSQVERVSGVDRYATSQAITADAFTASQASAAYIATGTNFPDALSASAVAGHIAAPVILVNGAARSIDSATSSLLTAIGASKAYVTGGPTTVSTGIETSLKNKLGTSNVTRLAGVDRYATGLATTKHGFAGETVSTVYLAVGTGFADALSGAALAGATDAALFIVPGNCVPAGVLDEINRMKATKVVLLGGPTTLTPAVAALTRC